MEWLQEFLKVGSDQDAEELDVDIVLKAEELRHATHCIARITGRSQEAGDIEEVLGVIFQRFCIGK